MPTLIFETLIHARAEECFDLIRDARIQPEPFPAIFGEFGVEQIVAFKSSFFGIEQSLTVKVTEFNRPILLVDEMTKGSFKSFKHTHEFLFVENGTLMRDTIVWESPCGFIGKLADKLFMAKRLTQLVTTRNAKLKELAEFTRS